MTDRSESELMRMIREESQGANSNRNNEATFVRPSQPTKTNCVEEPSNQPRTLKTRPPGRRF